MVATRKGMQRAMDAYWSQIPGLTAGSADLTENTGVVLEGGRRPDEGDARAVARSTTAFASTR